MIVEFSNARNQAIYSTQYFVDATEITLLNYPLFPVKHHPRA